MQRILLLIVLISGGALAYAQQPASERIVNVSGSVQSAIDAQVSKFNTGGRADVVQRQNFLVPTTKLFTVDAVI